MTSVHREKSREGINKGVMRKEKKERGSKEEERGRDENSHSPWHQRCMWLLEQVRGCRGRQHKLVRNCGNTERRSDRAVKFKITPFLCKHKCHTVICTTPRTEATMYGDDFRVFWKMTIKWSQREENHMALAVMLHRAEEDITVWKLKGKLCKTSLDALLILILWLWDGSAYGNIRLYIQALANRYQEEFACFFYFNTLAQKPFNFLVV